MATHLRDSTSIDVVADTCDAIATALQSDPKTCHLAETWIALTASADQLATDKRDLDRGLRRARARLSVADARWDGEVAAFARAALDASSGNRSVAPYSRFFDKTNPSAAQGYGHDREIALGEQWSRSSNVIRGNRSPRAFSRASALPPMRFGMRPRTGRGRLRRRRSTEPRSCCWWTR